MRVKYREDQKKFFRYIPNGLIHIVIILIIPYFLIGTLVDFIKGEFILELKESLFCTYVWRDKEIRRTNNMIAIVPILIVVAIIYYVWFY